MLDFINDFLNAHYWTVSYTLTYTLGTICGLAIVTRFIRMFPTYIKTGDLGSDKLGIFFSNSEYNGVHGWDFVKVKLRDFFTATHPETYVIDGFVCGFSILFLHVAWVLFVIAGIAALVVYGIVKFVQYLRGQHVKKQEFHSALKG
jgi:hypothetical protein